MSEAKEKNWIVLYDDHCRMCDFSVRFILPRDPKGVFRFAPLGGEFARAILEKNGIEVRDVPDSIVLVSADGKKVFVSSGAILRIARGLRLPWPLLAGFLIVPRPIRDAVYAWVARNRYRWFGRSDACLLPDPKWKSRFIA
jgi:predicted DCC family thiol-disulfide oxidoreductase YuxK